MHILVTNDDGPPDAKSSPYIASFVEALRKHHRVSVAVPSQQRSWIGKAHLLPPAFDPKNQGAGSKDDSAGDIISPSCYYASTGKIELLQNQLASSTKDSEEPWILVPGTPATCVQLALYHLFNERGPIDLVVSGPNHGRNTTAAFALSSGTLGGALEGAVCNRRSIALSYAFFTRQEGESIVDEANQLAVKLINYLASNWGMTRDQRKEAVDVYSINIPLVQNIGSNPVRWTWMLDNKWGTDSLYKEIKDAETTPADSTHRQFKWAPTFTYIWESVERSSPGNDGLAIREHCTSITPLCANFMHAGTYRDGAGEDVKL